MSIDIPLAFVLMPFNSELDEVYSHFIKKALEESGYEVLRADDIQSNRSIMQDIISHIERADLIVADLTFNNPNVYYELGIAHSFLKKVILLTQDIEELPFDLRAYRVIVYNTHFSKIITAKKLLTELALGALDGKAIFGSPISDYSQIDSSLVLKEENSQLNNDERGYIDHLSDFQEGTEEHTNITIEMTAVVKKIGTQIGSAATEMALANSDQSNTANKWKKRIYSKLANDFDLHTKEIDTFNARQHEIVDRIENSVEYIISFLNIETKEEIESTLSLISTFESFLIDSENTKQQILNFITVLSDSIGFEKNLNKSISQLIDTLNDTISNMDQLQSMYRRGIEVAKQKVAKKD